ncbi:DUF456 domain-containing protein [Desulfovibrio sp. OttesenSCG-928-C14]|nr:DUF456 domain-containing protein [Desulfovibrio sp. OttesenSCG-928-C14]
MIWTILAVIFIILMLGCLFLLLLGLPGNWVIIAFTGIWAWMHGAGMFGWQFFILIIFLAALGELVEFLAGLYMAKRYGGSNKGSLGGIIGAFAGGILCAPILFGLGALPGALAGGYLGCFVVEKLSGRKGMDAARAALGATIGRFGGFVVKLGIGISILSMSASRIWDSAMI